MAADEAGGLQEWPDGFPMALCSLTALTDLDLSLRAFSSPCLRLPEVRAWPRTVNEAPSAMYRCSLYNIPTSSGGLLCMLALACGALKPETSS